MVFSSSALAAEIRNALGEVMAAVNPRVLDLVSGISAFDSVLDEIAAEWSPDAAPLTTSMSDVDRAFAERTDDLDVADVTTVLRRLEIILRDGGEDEKNAVATGFLEAMAAVLDRFPDRKRILQHAGGRLVGTSLSGTDSAESTVTEMPDSPSRILLAPTWDLSSLIARLERILRDRFVAIGESACAR